MADNELAVLADRVEGLTGPDREVDVLIFQAIGAPAPFQFANKLIALEFNDIEQAYFASVTDDMRVRYSPPAYTASLDAAMALIDGDTFFHISRFSDGAEAHVYPNRYVGDDYMAAAASPALALTVAALRSRIPTPPRIEEGECG